MSEGYEVQGTGFVQRVSGNIDKIPSFDKRTGDHYWILITTYHVSDPARFYDPNDEEMLMDLENLVLTSPIGCFHCELVWTPRMSHRRCKGHP
jgi:hypothetical protein